MVMDSLLQYLCNAHLGVIDVICNKWESVICLQSPDIYFLITSVFWCLGPALLGSRKRQPCPLRYCERRRCAPLEQTVLPEHRDSPTVSAHHPCHKVWPERMRLSVTASQQGIPPFSREEGYSCFNLLIWGRAVGSSLLPPLIEWSRTLSWVATVKNRNVFTYPWHQLLLLKLKITIGPLPKLVFYIMLLFLKMFWILYGDILFAWKLFSVVGKRSLWKCDILSHSWVFANVLHYGTCGLDLTLETSHHNKSF